MTIRRNFTNNTGSAIDRLRFRLVEVTTFNATLVPDQADLRALDSTDSFVDVQGSPVLVLGTTVEQPPTQPMGGGWNSSLNVPSINGSIPIAPSVKFDSPSSGTIQLNTPLNNGSTVAVQFRLGVVQTGHYLFFVNIEAGNCSIIALQPCGPINQPALK